MQHTATHCHVLQHTHFVRRLQDGCLQLTHCNTTTYCNTLLHTATHSIRTSTAGLAGVYSSQQRRSTAHVAVSLFHVYRSTITLESLSSLSISFLSLSLSHTRTHAVCRTGMCKLARLFIALYIYTHTQYNLSLSLSLSLSRARTRAVSLSLVAAQVAHAHNHTRTYTRRCVQDSSINSQRVAVRLQMPWVLAVCCSVLQCVAHSHNHTRTNT